MTTNNGHPEVTHRECFLVLSDEGDPTQEFPHWISFRSTTPFAVIGHSANLTDDFYNRVKEFPKNPELQKELQGAFEGYVRD